MLTKISREDIQRLQNEGTHDNAAQIANLCLADFDALDIAFSDLVGEINTVEKNDDTERETAASDRLNKIQEIKDLNKKKPE